MADLGAIGKTRVLAIKSSDRIYGVPSNFAISLSQFNLDPTYVSYNQVALPNGFYNITSSLNTYSQRLSGAQTYTQTVTISPGNYNSTTLIAAFLAAVNSSTVNSNGYNDPNAPWTSDAAYSLNTSYFSASISATTGQFTMSDPTGTGHGLAFVPLAINSLDTILFKNSVPTFVAYNQSYTGLQILDLRTAPSIYIRSSLVAGNYITGGGPESVLAIVQNFAIFGQTIFHRNTNPDVDVYPVAGRVGLVTFQLVNEYGVELNMDSGQEWELSLCFYTP